MNGWILRRWAVGCAALGWFLAPHSGLVVAAGTPYRARAADVVLALAALVCLAQAEAVRDGWIPRPLARHLAGASVLGIAVVVAQARSPAASDELELAGLVVAALAPGVALAALRPTTSELVALAGAFTTGVLVSVATGLVGSRQTHLGYAVGLAQHKNQLAMTLVMAIPVVVLLPTDRLRWWVRAGLVAVLLVGLNETGSRSGLFGAAVVLVLVGVHWVREHPVRRVQVALAAVLLAVPMAGLLARAAGETDTAVARLIGDSTSERSDAQRAVNLRTALDHLDAPTLLVGDGYFLDPPPHNVLLETPIAGGLLAGAGLAVVLAGPAARLLAGPDGTRRGRLAYLGACSVAGYAACAWFNNVIWTSYVWCALALAAAAGSFSAADRHALDGRAPPRTATAPPAPPVRR